MTYSAVYCALISKRLNNPITKEDCYCEQHHIIPKSEGGDNSKDNLVNLTAREHYIAHLLLAKIYNDYKMSRAVISMRQQTKFHHREFKFNSHLFEKKRKDFARRVSKMFKGRPSPLKGKKMSMETRIKMSKSHLGQVSPRKGKKVSDDTRRKISKAGFGRKHSEETKRKLSLANKGRVSYFTGKHFSEEHRSKISKALVGHKSHVLGKKKYTNGTINVYAFECPEGFEPVRKIGNGKETKG